MRGSANWQVQQVFATVNRIGESKDAAKEEARAGGAETWAQVGAKKLVSIVTPRQTPTATPSGMS